MYYKITNKESEVYKKLFTQRTQELETEKENIKLIEEKIGFPFENSYGNHGQQNFQRVSRYRGFSFSKENEEKLDLKVWKKHKEHDGIYVPNLKTKLGREMNDFLNNLKCYFYIIIWDILEIDANLSRFKLPYVEICPNDTIVLYLDDNSKPKDEENVIEITSKEFYEHLKFIKD